MNTLTHERACQYLHLDPKELAASERAQLEAHLAECAACRAYAAQIETLRPILSRVMRARWDRYAASANLFSQVPIRFRREIMRRRIFSFAGAIAGLAVLVTFTISFSGILKSQTAGPASGTQPIATAMAKPTPSATCTPPSVPITFPKIDRNPAPAYWHRDKMTAIPTYDPNSNEVGQVDLRSHDLSSFDLTQSLSDLLYADFDSQTVWPPDDKMPKDFDWKRIMELGKNPGLGVRKLHAQGITGRGVGIAIVDGILLGDQPEYADRLRLYEEAEGVTASENKGADMHGTAVASIAVGKTIGVAPEADLYYIAAALTGDVGARDFTDWARGVRRILEINRQLPVDQKIRVLSMSVGWDPGEVGYDEMMAAANEAKAAGMLVVCSSIEKVHGFKFHGLGRLPLADPDLSESYEPGMFWARDFYTGRQAARNFYADRLLVPMDSRTTASPNGAHDYVFYREGGWSWSIPYIAGMYALAAQVDPQITPGRFWSLALKTGRTIQLEHEGQTIPFGPILDPAALIDALQKGG